MRATLRASALTLWFMAAPAADATKYAPTLQDLLAASTPADWRALDPDNTLYLEVGTGRVVIQLAPAFAPLHAANIRTLAHAGYYDDLAINRVQGMELLSSLPRGSGAMVFYDSPEQRVPIVALHLATDVPPAQRSDLEVLRTDSPFFRPLVKSRRNRGGDWYQVPAGHIDLCNVPLPVRQHAGDATKP
jgi:hypothetical protein